jgi:hypothetical protein
VNTLEYVHGLVIPAAFKLLPDNMNTIAAKAMLLAIGLQESGFKYRRQIGGPARSFWQFERAGGVAGVLTHRASKPHITPILRAMGYDFRATTSHNAIEHNDVLACAFARLLLWTSPRGLPISSDAAGGWAMYIECWRPGEPRRESWVEHYSTAWKIALGD